MLNANTFVKNAIRNTPSSYWEKLCRTRAGSDPECEGSRFPRRTHEQVDKLIRQLVWEPYTHSAVKEPAQAFIARSIPGLELGVTRLGDIPDNAELVFSDPKDTGKVELVWNNPPASARPKVDFVVMLVGPDDHPVHGESPRNVVWTFFPGDPIQPSTILNLDNHGSTNKEHAAELGIEWVKVGFTQTEKNLEGSKKVLNELDD